MSASGQNGTPERLAVKPTGRTVEYDATSDIASVRVSSTDNGLNTPASLSSVCELIFGSNGGNGPDGHGPPSEPEEIWNVAVSFSAPAGSENGVNAAWVVYVPHVAGVISGACWPSR